MRLNASTVVDKLVSILEDEHETAERQKTKKERQKKINKKEEKNKKIETNDSLMLTKQLVPEFHFVAKQMIISTENKTEYLYLNGGNKVFVLDLNKRSPLSHFDLPFGCDHLNFFAGKVWCFSNKESLIRTFSGSENKKIWKRK